MNFKIIKTEPSLPDVLIYRDADERGMFVRIYTIGTVNELEDQIVFEDVIFDNNTSTATGFISNFNKANAEEWLSENEVIL